MAKRTKLDEKIELQQPIEEVPQFVLKANNPAHLKALMALQGDLNGRGQWKELKVVKSVIRKFELFEEAHR